MAKEGSEETLERMKNDGVKFVNMQFSDMMGTTKSITIPFEKFVDSFPIGIWFDGSSVPGFARIYESDMRLIPDLNTYAPMPWLEGNNGKTARVICDVYTPEGKPYESDPRYMLKKVVKEAEEMGYTFNAGPEMEFFLFRKENGHIKTAADQSIEPHDKGQYFELVMDLGFEVRKEMMVTLQQMGIDVEASHHEVAPGQHEIDFKYGDAVSAADRVQTVKYALKAVAQKYGLYVTFMPKPISGVNGSGMHVHQSMFTASGENAFFDANDKYKLSAVAYQFLAGQLKHAKAMCGVLNPTVNSYKRLIPGYEAATYMCWAQRNRSVLIRVPRYTPGKEKSTRLEIRCPDASSNPYLAFAVLLKAGLDGIKNKMEAPLPTEENVFELDAEGLMRKKIDVLPYSLIEAINALEKDELINGVLGKESLPKYIKAKKAEWDSYRIAVTDWERKRYLETI